MPRQSYSLTAQLPYQSAPSYVMSQNKVLPGLVQLHNLPDAVASPHYPVEAKDGTPPWKSSYDKVQNFPLSLGHLSGHQYKPGNDPEQSVLLP